MILALIKGCFGTSESEFLINNDSDNFLMLVEDLGDRSWWLAAVIHRFLSFGDTLCFRVSARVGV